MKRYLTISVDDGVPQDLRTAELFAELGLKATFYIPARNPDGKILANAEILSLAKNFEVGGHTFNHRPLKNLATEEIRREVRDGKAWLEDASAQSVVSFCYPLGKFNARVAGVVKESGFIGARTCLFNLTDWPKDPFHFGLSTHAYSHKPLIQARHAVIEGNFRGLWNFASTFRFAEDWEEHFRLALDHVQKVGGIAHLYFHSWEIDGHGQWDKLKRVLKDAASRPSFERVTNGELFRRFSRAQAN